MLLEPHYRSALVTGAFQPSNICVNFWRRAAGPRRRSREPSPRPVESQPWHHVLADCRVVVVKDLDVRADPDRRMEEVLEAEDVAIERRHVAQDEVVDRLDPREPDVDASGLRLDVVEASEHLRLIGSERPHAERRPDLRLGVGRRGAGVALLVQVLGAHAELRLLEADQSLGGRAVLVGGTRAVVEVALDVQTRLAVEQANEAYDLVLVGLGALARLVADLQTVAYAGVPQRAGKHQAEVARAVDLVEVGRRLF